MKKGRDSKGRFIKGMIPSNKGDYRSFTSARKHARKLKLKNVDEWKK